MNHSAAAIGWVEDERRPQATSLHYHGLPAPEPLLHRYVLVFLFPARVQAPKVKSSASFVLGIHEVLSHRNAQKETEERHTE